MAQQSANYSQLRVNKPVSMFLLSLGCISRVPRYCSQSMFQRQYIALIDSGDMYDAVPGHDGRCFLLSKLQRCRPGDDMVVVGRVRCEGVRVLVAWLGRYVWFVGLGMGKQGGGCCRRRRLGLGLRCTVIATGLCGDCAEIARRVRGNCASTA